MPPKTLITEDAFAVLDAQLRQLGFSKKKHKEGIKNMQRLGLIPVTWKKNRGEVGYEYFACGLRVHVWTTYSEKDGVMNDEDLGWVLVTEGDVPVYFASPFLRTKNFIQNIVSYADILKKKVDNRPLCPVCKRYMKITKGRHLRQRLWKCDNTSHLSQTKPWDYGLSKEDKQFLARRRKATKGYNKKREAEGLPKKGTAMLQRKGWYMHRPENIEIQTTRSL